MDNPYETTLDMPVRELEKAKYHTNINYLKVLNYLDDNHGRAYRNPEDAQLDALEKELYLETRYSAQAAVGEIKKMAELCKSAYGLDRCERISWLDGANLKKTSEYLWAQMKYSRYADNPISISIFVEISPVSSRARYRVSLEIRSTGADEKQMDLYHSHLDMPLPDKSPLVYGGIKKESEIPDIVHETASEIKAKIEADKADKNNKDNKNNQDNTYQRYPICGIVERTDTITNDDFEAAMLEAVKELIPYYRHVIGDEDTQYYPSLTEYNPGITAAEYERILGDDSLVKRTWLDTIYYLYLMGGAASCKQIANKYGNGAPHYNTNAINVAKTVHKETNCPLRSKETGEKQYWPVLFFGRDLPADSDGIFCYKMREPLADAVRALEKRGVFREMKEANKLAFDKNLILYGPPGTGKTYQAAIYAVAICEGTPLEELTDYDVVMEKYNALKKSGRIAFTTFHQSYGYEEFMEGIKPVIGEGNDGPGYTIEDGVFKAFCKNAEIPTDIEVDHAAKIWKTVLKSGDTVKQGNSVKKECFHDGKIMFNWKTQAEESGSYAFNLINHFRERVNVGDIVVSYAGAGTSIDAIGVITGDAVYDESRPSYRWSRTVNWLDVGIVRDIKALNGNKFLGNDSLQELKRVNIVELMKLVEKADTVPNEQNYVFIIDEINRGNISKILGELITLMEPAKRAGMPEAASAVLPYSGTEFSVPSNVYIVGTMNTADRSIALMDTALRRRFQFIEMIPRPQVLRDIHADKVEDLDVAGMLAKINERITFLYDREHTIGHAFFTGLRGEDATIEKLKSIFEKSVIPLLQEYFYEDYQKIQLVLGDNAKSSNDLKFIIDEKAVAKDIFKGNVEDIIDLPEKRYLVNKAALDNLNSYKEIL